MIWNYKYMSRTGSFTHFSRSTCDLSLRYVWFWTRLTYRGEFESYSIYEREIELSITHEASFILLDKSSIKIKIRVLIYLNVNATLLDEQLIGLSQILKIVLPLNAFGHSCERSQLYHNVFKVLVLDRNLKKINYDLLF